MLGTFYVGATPFMAARMPMRAGLLTGEASSRHRVLLVAIARSEGGLEHPANPDTPWGDGDSAYVIGPYEGLVDVLRGA